MDAAEARRVDRDDRVLVCDHARAWAQAWMATTTACGTTDVSRVATKRCTVDIRPFGQLEHRP
jgi:hypothetical protein